MAIVNHVKILVKRAAGDPSTSLYQGELGYDTVGKVLYVGNGIGAHATTVGTTIGSLDDVGDVSVGSVGINQFLTWNGTFWVPGAPGATLDYVDGSLATRDSSIEYNLNQIYQLDASIADLILKDANIDISLNDIYFEFSNYETKVNLDASFNDIYAQLAGEATLDYVDGSLAARDSEISQLDASIQVVKAIYIPDASLNDSYFVWNGGILDVSVGGDVTLEYVDASLLSRDAEIAQLDSSIINLRSKDTNIDSSLNELWIQVNAFEANDVTFAYVDGSLATRDTDISNLQTKDTNIDSSLNELWIDQLSQDTDISNLQTKDSNIDVSLNDLWGNFDNYETKVNLDSSFNAIYAQLSSEATLDYVDGSLATRDIEIAQLEASIVRIDASLGIINELDDIGNVDTTTKSINQVLTWNGTSWVALDVSTAGTGATYAYVDGSLNYIKATYIPDVSLSDTYFIWNAGFLEVSAGGGDVTQAYVDGSLALRDVSISYNLTYITEVSTNVGSTQYSSNLFINDGDNHETSLSNLDQIMGLIAPAKPELLTSQSLTTSGTTTYSAILPTGLASSWYTDASNGDTITDYVIDDTFILTTPNYTSDPPTFRAGLYQDIATSGTLSALVNGASVAAYDMTAGVGNANISTSDASGLLRCNSTGGYGGAESNFWRKAQAYISVTNQNEGLVTYAITHSEALTSNTSNFRYDDVASSPSFSVAPAASIGTDASVYLSGIAHYGVGTTFTTTYTGGAGIFRKAYHATNVGRLTSTFGSTITSNPASVPDVDDTFPVSETFTFNTANQSSGSSNATITAYLYKPNTNTSQVINLSRRANTYSTTRATTTIEYFTDESRRLLDASSGTDTSWDSTNYTIFNPDNGAYAQVQNGTLRYPVSADYGGFSFTGDKIYQRRFTKAAASSGTLTFSGFNPSSYVSPYGSGDVNALIFLSDQGLYFDLGREFGIGGGDGSSMATGISAYTSLTSTQINWSLGTYSTGNETTHTGTFVLIIIFRNSNRTMTQITSS